MKSLKGSSLRRAAVVSVCVMVAFAVFIISSFADNNGANFGVENYTSGDEWDITAGKALIINTGELQTNQGGYTIRITLSKGMRLKSYLWNLSDTDNWTVGDGVQGTAVPMDNATGDYFAGGSVELDANGNTILSYRTSEGCNRMNLTDKVVVEPDSLITYSEDNISDAIEFQLLDSADTEVASSKVDLVKIAKNRITNSSYSAKKFTPGQKNAMLYQIDYYRVDLVNMIPGTVNVTLSVPDCVDNITRVRDEVNNVDIPAEKLSFDAENHVLSITGYEQQEGQHFKCSLYGDISETAVVRNSAYSTNNSLTKFEYTDTYNQGTPSFTMPDGFSTLSSYNIFIVAGQDVLRLDNSGTTAMSQSPDGYPLIFGKIRNFYTSNALTEDQIITWDFDDDTIDVVGVFFPKDSGNTITVTSVTLDNGVTYPVNVVLPDESRYMSSLLQYVNVAKIRENSTGIPDDARFIRSITANCGTFSAAYSSASWYGKPVGYFSDAIVDAGEEATIEFRFKVNNADAQKLNVTYDPNSEISCLNVVNDIYSDELMKKAATNFKAGETIYMRTRVGVGGNLLFSTGEPRFYVVVPQWMSFDPSEVKAKPWVTTTNSANPAPADYFDDIRWTYGYVKNAAGESFVCYEFYVPDSAVGNYLEQNGYRQDTGSNNTSIAFEYSFKIDDTASTQDVSIGDYVLAGKGNIATGEFLPARGQISGSDKPDLWDLDGDGNRSEKDVVVGAKNSVTLLDNMNITVSGYLTHEGVMDAVNPYDPGSDGSNEVNVVEFLPDSNADYHVIISNTLVSIGQTCSVNAYIPVPNGKVENDEFDPSNTDETHKFYQFNDYQWPMELRGAIDNVDPNNFDIVYYLDAVTLSSNGEPTATDTIVNPSSLTNEQLDRVVLIEIRSKEGIKIPSGRYEFTLPLKVGVDETTATSAGLNLTKNIFRPRYHREGGIGAVWVDGNYVAARLAVSSIGGIIFEDANGNGIRDEGEDAMSGVTVELYDSGGTKIAEKTSDSEGKYSFITEDLGGQASGTYTIRFINPDDSEYVFTKNHAATQDNYKKNSEAVASSDQSYAEASITIPYSGVLSGYQEYQNAGLFVDKVGGGADGNSPDGIPDACEVRVDYDAEHGSVKSGDKTFEYLYKADGHGYTHSFDLSIKNPPVTEPDTGCAFVEWTNSVNDDKNSDGKFTFANVSGGTSLTVTAVYEPRSYTVTYDMNAEQGDELDKKPDDQTKLYDVDLTLSNLMPEREDGTTHAVYSFTSWNTKADGSGDTYLRGATYKLNSDLTLYAQWDSEINYFDVYHFTEKPDASGYDEHTVEHRSGQYGEIIPVKALSIPGFTFFEYDRDLLQEWDFPYEEAGGDTPIMERNRPKRANERCYHT